MPCFVHFFLVSAVQKLLKSVKIWQSCSQMYTATFYKPRQKCRFWIFQVRCKHRLGDVINFMIVACRISSRLKWYKNYENRLRLAKVIVKNKMSRFLWFSVYILQLIKIINTYQMQVWLICLVPTNEEDYISDLKLVRLSQLSRGSNFHKIFHTVWSIQSMLY